MYRARALVAVGLVVGLSSLGFGACSPGESALDRRVVKGHGLLKKSVFFERRMTTITQLERVPTTSGGGNLLGVFGQKSVALVDADSGATHAIIDFDRASLSPVFVPARLGEKPLILCGGGGYGDVALLGSDGRTRWSRPGGRYRCATFGDLDADGEIEFYLGRRDGLDRVDPNGREVWATNGRTRFKELATFDPRNGRAPFVVALTQDYDLQTYDGSGTLLSSMRLPGRVLHFQVLRWPLDSGNVRVVYLRSAGRTKYIGVCDLSGKLEFEYRVSSEYPAMFGLECTVVRFREDEAPYLAVLNTFSSRYGKSMLSLFSLDGSLVYQEILGRSTGLLAMSDKVEAGEREVLLVGDSRPRRVIKYTRSYERGHE